MRFKNNFHAFYHFIWLCCYLRFLCRNRMECVGLQCFSISLSDYYIANARNLNRFLKLSIRNAIKITVATKDVNGSQCRGHKNNVYKTTFVEQWDSVSKATPILDDVALAINYFCEPNISQFNYRFPLFLSRNHQSESQTQNRFNKSCKQNENNLLALVFSMNVKISLLFIISYSFEWLKCIKFYAFFHIYGKNSRATSK